jgi:RNA polymerase sigma-70 factor (ECF subfamily)
MNHNSVSAGIEVTIRQEWGRILASLTKNLGDLQLAEDCLQDAVVSALNHWGKNGLPNSPAAWLIQTARRKAIDRIRRRRNFASKESEIAHLMEMDAEDAANDQMHQCPDAIPDKRLEMIFTCCHPAIEEKSRLALTLRTIGGLSTDEIARAFLDKPDAMAARLTRSKKKISAARIPYEIPDGEALPERLASVLGVIYLIFNEGYSATKGDHLIRKELCAEALRLARMVQELLPTEPETAGLVALILLHDARRPARLGNDDLFIPLELQDRKLWDSQKIREGSELLKSVLAAGRIGPYQLQAAISACHCGAPSWDETDWNEISALYGLLHQIQPSPVIKLNRAYALSHFRTPGEALDLLDQLQGELANYQPYHATRADLLKRLGDLKGAAASYDLAISLSSKTSEKAWLKNMRKKLELN